MTFKIENTPIDVWQHQLPTAVFPFGELKVGQSFLVPLSMRLKVQRAATTFRAYRPESGVKIVTRTVKDGVRVIRVK
jgi:hypothetical protein